MYLIYKEEFVNLSEGRYEKLNRERKKKEEIRIYASVSFEGVSVVQQTIVSTALLKMTATRINRGGATTATQRVLYFKTSEPEGPAKTD